MIRLLVIVLLASSCALANNNESITGQYCIVDDRDNDMGLRLKQVQDTFFVYYDNFIDNGNYINAGVDSNDYAGYFMAGDLRRDSIAFKIKSYREEDSFYLVQLRFLDGGKRIIWRLDDKLAAYLPKKAEFTKCGT